MKEILDRCLKAYCSYGIDICICDDSDDDKTKELIEGYISEGATNLFYVGTPKGFTGDLKYLRIIQGYYLPKQYDYIWPCKDRVCFDESFVGKIRSSIEEGHDAVIGAYEFARWDVGENLNRDVYTDPAELYRLYAVVSTNWECIIRKRSTMLDSIDWANYSDVYKLGELNSFNQTITFFAALAEMDSCSVKICRYTDERFISDKASSDWKKKVFELWIDKWVAANFSLPSIYDKYKLEAIKSQTNLSELFGSVERMIEFHKAGLYTSDVYEKYKNMWAFISNIPSDYLKLIAEGNYEEAACNTIKDFEQCFNERDFKKAWWLISANGFIVNHYDEGTTRILIKCFNWYRMDMMSKGVSNVFDGVTTLDDLIKREF